MSLAKALNQTVGAAIHIADMEVPRFNNQLHGELSEVVVTAYGAKTKNNEELPKIEFQKIKVSAKVNGGIRDAEAFQFNKNFTRSYCITNF